MPRKYNSTTRTPTRSKYSSDSVNQARGKRINNNPVRSTIVRPSTTTVGNKRPR